MSSPKKFDVEGLPIGAKFKGPGPLYSLPPTLGPNAKYIGTRSPAFSFGVKMPLKNESIGPGPATFAPKINSKSPSFSLQGGFKKTRKDGRAVIFGSSPNREDPSEVDLDNPGPAKYNVTTTTSMVERAPAYTITSRPPEEKAAKTPGPAAYCLPNSLGTRQISVKSSPAPTIAAIRLSKREYLSPGPAAYNAINQNKMRTSSPMYSLGARWEKDPGAAYSKTIPGPGAYNPSGNSKPYAPSYSFRRKHSEYEYFVPDESEPGPLII